MIDGKQRRGVQHPGRTISARHGEGGEVAHRGGDIGGKEERGRSRREREEGTTGEKVRRGVVVWVQLLARAYIYSCYI